MTCTGGVPGANADALFAALLAEMQEAYPALTTANVIVIFEGTNVGAAGSVGGVFPLVTVKLTGVKHEMIVGHLIYIDHVEFPDFEATVLGNGKWVNTA